MSIKENITDFIGAAANEKPVAAYNSFSAAIEDKVQGLLDQRQDEIRASLFATEEAVQAPYLKVLSKEEVEGESE